MPTPTESFLDTKMRRLASEPTERNRFAVYTALLNAELVVPLTPEAKIEAGYLPMAHDLACETSDETGEGRVFVVFGDDFGLVRWRVNGGRRARIKGALLFPILADAGCVMLRINPKSGVGGMLYGHEVQTIAEAALRRSVLS